MEVKELMIDDWVFNSNGERCKVVSLFHFDDSIIYLDNYDREDIYYYESEAIVQPIPLTEEILEKNGWVDADYSITDSPDHNFFPEDTEHKLELMVGCGNTIQWTINTGEYIIMEIKYVHQLQHALRLCKIEKEIEL